jgi:hypothetical protein
MWPTAIPDRAVHSEAQLRGQVDKIVHSPALSGSETLRHLLSFLADKCVEFPGQPIREKEIAVGVFARRDFDPQTDSVVRVHAGRLRSKLAEYYVGDGVGDPVVIKVPRGAYNLSCCLRELPQSESAATALARAPKPAPLYRRALPWTAATLAFAAAVAMGFFWGARTSASGALPGKALSQFWRDFTADREGPLVIYGNPPFIGSDFSGMRYARETDDSREATVDTFTSVGDLTGVFEMTRLFSSIGRPPQLKRAQLFAWDDAVDKNLVIVGSPISIRALRELPLLEEFQFKDRTVEPKIGVGAILNRHPSAGEQAVYFGPDSRPYQFDYAVIALLPGINATRRTMMLSGITSFGTQAAANFVCREAMVEQLLEKLRNGGQPRGQPLPKYFESLIRVTVSGGVPVQPEILITRPRK